MSSNAIACETLVRVLTGLSEYTVLHATESNNELVVEVIATRIEAACPGCGEFSSRVKSVRTHIVRDVPSAGRPCKLVVQKRSFRCVAPSCSRSSFTQHTNELPALKRVTGRCRELIGRAGKDRSTASVAREFGVSWSTAWNAVVAVATRELAARGRRIPSVFGIDETRFTRKQPWLTGTVDLHTSELIAMFCGRTATDLTTWLNTLTNEEKGQVIAVVIDPHAGYRAALRTGLPNTVIVGDRFHFEQHTGRAVTDVRRRRIWEQQQHRGRKTDPGWRARHDLLRSHDRLTRKGRSRLLRALHADTQNPDDPIGQLAYAYAARHDFSRIYQQATSRQHAHRMLINWYQFIAEHPIKELIKLATTISAWENEFLNYFDHRITNGRTEGRNRTIKATKRTGYGYRNTTNYTLKCQYQALRLTSWTTPTPKPQAA